MEFTVGDKIMHPILGPGTITSVDHQAWVEGFGDYYVIKMRDRGLIVRLPVDKMETVGVRPVISQSKLDLVLKTLCTPPCLLPEDPDERNDALRLKLSSGQAMDGAEALRDLAWRKSLGRPTKRDSDLMTRARQLLVTEIAVVTGEASNDVTQRLEALLAESVARATAVAAAADEAAPAN